ncbi:hypothetical protein GQ42DRAFT_154970 [Ramicandelaber brevisporus]|nr:hypothetical protein GQ42DRAFT_154970 [Ramicandelaber brevisporus]
MALQTGWTSAATTLLEALETLFEEYRPRSSSTQLHNQQLLRRGSGSVPASPASVKAFDSLQGIMSHINISSDVDSKRVNSRDTSGNSGSSNKRASDEMDVDVPVISAVTLGATATTATTTAHSRLPLPNARKLARLSPRPAHLSSPNSGFVSDNDAMDEEDDDVSTAKLSSTTLWNRQHSSNSQSKPLAARHRNFSPPGESQLLLLPPASSSNLFGVSANRPIRRLRQVSSAYTNESKPNSFLSSPRLGSKLGLVRNGSGSFLSGYGASFGAGSGHYQLPDILTQSGLLSDSTSMQFGSVDQWVAHYAAHNNIDSREATAELESRIAQFSQHAGALASVVTLSTSGQLLNMDSLRSAADQLEALAEWFEQHNFTLISDVLPWFHPQINTIERTIGFIRLMDSMQKFVSTTHIPQTDIHHSTSIDEVTASIDSFAADIQLKSTEGYGILALNAIEWRMSNLPVDDALLAQCRLTFQQTTVRILQMCIALLTQQMLEGVVVVSGIDAAVRALETARDVLLLTGEPSVQFLTSLVDTSAAIVRAVRQSTPAVATTTTSDASRRTRDVRFIKQFSSITKALTILQDIGRGSFLSIAQVQSDSALATSLDPLMSSIIECGLNACERLGHHLGSDSQVIDNPSGPFCLLLEFVVGFVQLVAGFAGVDVRSRPGMTHVKTIVKFVLDSTS